MPLLPATFPDAQLVVIDYLRPLLDPVPVMVRVPTSRPSRFVTLRRVGGLADGVVDRPRIDLFGWAQSDEDAHDLVMVLRRHVAAMPGVREGAVVVRCEEFAGPHTAPDESGQPRWLVTFEITLRGVA